MKFCCMRIREDKSVRKGTLCRICVEIELHSCITIHGSETLFMSTIAKVWRSSAASNKPAIIRTIS
jgi:hypothetical protein